MKVALFYANWENYGEPWSTPLGVRWELEERGHEVQIYNLYHNDGDLLPKKRIRTYSADCFNRFNFDFKNHGYRPDVVLVMDYGVFDCPQMNKEHFPGIPFILEAGDTPQSFRMQAQKAGKFHAVVTPDHQSAELFSQMGLISKWMPHWADHRIFIKTEQEPIYDCVSTCGPRGKGLTEQMQAELGTRFNNERYFFGLEHAERLRMGKIVFQHSQFGEMTRRIFEGMACGRMVLADRMSDVVHMDELFTEGEDIIYYSNAQEAIDAVNYYATHDEEREAIALNGYSKVMANHTVSHRVDVIEDLVTEIRQETLQC